MFMLIYDSGEQLQTQRKRKYVLLTFPAISMNFLGIVHRGIDIFEIDRRSPAENRFKRREMIYLFEIT